MDELKMSTPWQVYYREVEALFKGDPDVTVEFDDARKELTLRVQGEEKASALMALMPYEREFGNVVVRVRVVPANGVETVAEVFRRAFEGNSALVDVVSSDKGLYGLTYALFRREVVSYWGDNLGDPNGMEHTLYQDIAADVLEPCGVQYTTEGE